jgi:hypothetical protein
MQEQGAATFTNCRFSENGASAQGGALALSGGTLTVTRCTLVRNSVTGADGAAGGGGIYVSDGSTLHLDSCVVAENTAPSGPDLWSHGGGLTARRCWIGNAANSGLTDGADENRTGSAASPLLEKDAPAGAGAATASP